LSSRKSKILFFDIPVEPCRRFEGTRATIPRQADTVEERRIRMDMALRLDGLRGFSWGLDMAARMNFEEGGKLEQILVANSLYF